MLTETEISNEELDYIEWSHQQAQIRNDDKEAHKHVDRWMHVIRAELHRMHEEGIDPYIAWLAVVMTTDMWGDHHWLSELKPAG